MTPDRRADSKECREELARIVGVCDSMQKMKESRSKVMRLERRLATMKKDERRL